MIISAELTRLRNQIFHCIQLHVRNDWAFDGEQTLFTMSNNTNRTKLSKTRHRIQFIEINMKWTIWMNTMLHQKRGWARKNNTKILLFKLKPSLSFTKCMSKWAIHRRLNYPPLSNDFSAHNMRPVHWFFYADFYFFRPNSHLKNLIVWKHTYFFKFLFAIRKSFAHELSGRTFSFAYF